MPKESIGQAIRRCREEQGWSRRRLGYELDIGESTIARWEDGTSDPEARNLVRLQVLFGDPITRALVGSIDDWLAEEPERREAVKDVFPTLGKGTDRTERRVA